MSYWYFSFEVCDREQQWKRRDSTVVAGRKGLFPIGRVYDYAKEEFGDGIQLIILNAMEISAEDFGYLSNELAGDEPDEPETDS